MYCRRKHMRPCQTSGDRQVVPPKAEVHLVGKALQAAAEAGLHPLALGKSMKLELDHITLHSIP